MSEAFFEARGPDRFLATELTRGPWDPGLQHAGPPAALLGRAVERHGDRPGLRVARITFDIVRPLPIAELQVTTRLLRGGRSVELVEATLRAGEVEVMRATALRIRTVELDLPAGLTPGPRLPGPDAGHTMPFFSTGQEVGYHTAMEFRFVAGSFLELGPATVWMRMRHPLVPGEPPSPLCRVLVAADSGNGVSAVLDYQRWRFITPTSPSTSPAPRPATGSPWRRRPRPRPASAWPTPPSTTSTAPSAAPPRPCSSTAAKRRRGGGGRRR